MLYFRIIPRATESDYISIYRGDGCTSFVGKQGGKQLLSLARRNVVNGKGTLSCATNVGVPMHELMHAIGKHERRHFFE